MTSPPNGITIQAQLGEISQILSRLMVDLPRSGDTQIPRVLRDVSQVYSSLIRISSAVANQMVVRDRQVDALTSVGSMINSSLGLDVVLSEVMDKLIALMHAERGFLMLKTGDGKLEVRIARGMEKVDLSEERFAISSTIASRVANSGEAILTTNAQEDPRFSDQTSIAAHRLLSILCVPLKIKEELIGVMYVDNRIHSGIFKPNDLELVTSFANQAAIAIENARLIDGLKESNNELETAYQATLEGWVRALDLRDRETEGHTQRVTALTEKLARKLELDDTELIHVRRGALLHDIGKMAIPDGILLKPGDLSPEERMIVQKHPVYAYEMLKPIKFLSTALDIPYCHHEKWDGTGYPRGLRGEAIPLAARIFTVVDVWDALISDRPYRKGLMPKDIRRYISNQAGAYFDPTIVEAFLSLVG
jgi:putative nucleotidyltransferase with HDIG domain